MNLPIEKQFEIMDLIYQEKSARYIAKQAHVSKTTAQEYKKLGPPIYRKHSRNAPSSPVPTSWQEERKWFIQTIEEGTKRANQHKDEMHKAYMKIKDLTREKNQKDEKINNLTQQNKDQQGEIQKLTQEMDDRKEKGMKGLQKIDASYSYIKSEKDKYKNKYLEAEKQIHLLEEKLRQNLDSNQEIQTTMEATTPINSDTNKHSIWDDPALYAITIAGEFLKEFNKAYKPKEMIRKLPISDQPVLSHKKNPDENNDDQKTNNDTSSIKKT